MAEKQENGNIMLFNIEVPKEVINDKQPPKNMQNRAKSTQKPAQKSASKTTQKKVTKDVPNKQTKKPTQKADTKADSKKQTKPVQEEPEFAREEISDTSKEVLQELEQIIANTSKIEEKVEEPVVEKEVVEIKEEKKVPQNKQPQKKPAQKKPAQTSQKKAAEAPKKAAAPKKKPAQERTLSKETGPTKKLATEEAKKASVEKEKKSSIKEIKLPSKTTRPTNKGNIKNQIATWFIPTQGDGMNEILRKGLVIICLVVLIFSMGVLFKTTRLEKKVSEKNAGTYFVNKYVTSYEIYKDKEN